MLDIRLVRLEDEANPKLVAACHRLLNAPEQQRAASFRLAAARQQFIVGRALIRVSLSMASGGSVAPRDWRVNQTSAGRPFVQNGPIFSLSHTGGLIACATSSEDVGLDVERIRRQIDLASMSKALTQTERLSLGRLPDEERGTQFASIWTAKEAAAKACGRGLAIDFQKIVLHATPEGFNVTGSAGDWVVWQTRLVSDHCLAAATREPASPIVHPLSTDELLQAVAQYVA